MQHLKQMMCHLYVGLDPRPRVTTTVRIRRAKLPVSFAGLQYLSRHVVTSKTGKSRARAISESN